LTGTQSEAKYLKLELTRRTLRPGQNGVVWNGLVSVIETPSGGETRSFYYDGKKFLTVASSEEMAGTINAYYSPPEFDICDGSLEPEDGVYAWQQRRSSLA
jgi:hypothetical protein